LISHTAGGILSTQTGLYPDRHGITVSNSYGYFTPAHSVAFSSAFKYWTDLVDDNTGLNDPFPNMVTDGQKTTPAPWVPFTRAGCDFGAISLANIELENTGTGPFGDMSEAFGTGSPEWNEAVASNAAPSGTAARAKALTDFVGIAVHCAQGGGICAANATNAGNSRPDKLPDEPGGYLGYQALYGAKYVNPAVCAAPSAQCSMIMDQAAVNNTEGQPVTDPFGQPGLPGLAGGIGIPQSDGTLGYSHTNCSWTTTPACPSNQIGEVNLNLRTKLGNSTFQVHSDSAPTVYVNGQPPRTDPTLRNLERSFAGLNAIDPYVSSTPAPVFQKFADPIEQQTLHMQNTDPARTPSFTAFAD